MSKETGDENKDHDQEGPLLENPHDEGPGGDVVEEHHQHGGDHPDQ